MAYPTALLGLGMQSFLAQEICGRVANAITATGAAQGDALLVPAIINVVTTTASGTGVRLPVAEQSAGVTVANLGANALLVYPAVGGTINGAAVNTALSVPVGKTVQLFGLNGTAWIGQVGA